jgi:hypothetical protein
MRVRRGVAASRARGAPGGLRSVHLDLRNGETLLRADPHTCARAMQQPGGFNRVRGTTLQTHNPSCRRHRLAARASRSRRRRRRALVSRRPSRAGRLRPRPRARRDLRRPRPPSRGRGHAGRGAPPASRPRRVRTEHGRPGHRGPRRRGRLRRRRRRRRGAARVDAARHRARRCPARRRAPGVGRRARDGARAAAARDVQRRRLAAGPARVGRRRGRPGQHRPRRAHARSLPRPRRPGRLALGPRARRPQPPVPRERRRVRAVVARRGSPAPLRGGRRGPGDAGRVVLRLGRQRVPHAARARACRPRHGRLFPGSWSQWSNDASRPVATGED